MSQSPWEKVGRPQSKAAPVAVQWRQGHEPGVLLLKPESLTGCVPEPLEGLHLPMPDLDPCRPRAPPSRGSGRTLSTDSLRPLHASRCPSPGRTPGTPRLRHQPAHRPGVRSVRPRPRPVRPSCPPWPPQPLRPRPPPRFARNRHTGPLAATRPALCQPCRALLSAAPGRTPCASLSAVRLASSFCSPEGPRREHSVSRCPPTTPSTQSTAWHTVGARQAAAEGRDATAAQDHPGSPCLPPCGADLRIFPGLPAPTLPSL